MSTQNGKSVSLSLFFFLNADIINSVEMRNVKSYLKVVAFHGWGVVTS